VREIPKLKFEKPSRFKRAMVNAALLLMTKEKIICNKEKCIRCGVCARHCPKGAISLKPYPEINPGKCIRCFCCIELCPEHALHLQDNIVRKIANKLRKK